jgi:23S rRNA A2030 N6-methylase RlmJ
MSSLNIDSEMGRRCLTVVEEAAQLAQEVAEGIMKVNQREAEGIEDVLKVVMQMNEG